MLNLMAIVTFRLPNYKNWQPVKIHTKNSCFYFKSQVSVDFKGVRVFKLVILNKLIVHLFLLNLSHYFHLGFYQCCCLNLVCVCL